MTGQAQGSAVGAQGHLATAGGLIPRFPELNTSTFSTPQCSLSSAALKILQKTPDGCQQGWSYPANAKLLNPTLVATALIRKPEMVCKRLCVLHSVVSHLFKYCREKGKHGKEEQTQLSRALIHFQRGRLPVLCFQTKAIVGNPIGFELKLQGRSSSCHPPPQWPLWVPRCLQRYI